MNIQESTTKISKEKISEIIENLAEKIKNANFLQSDTHKNESLSYFKSYFEFLEYFAKHKPYSEHEFIVGTNMAYGWMPTKFNIHEYPLEENSEKVSRIPKVLEIINKAQTENSDLSKDDYEILASCINNSIVGASKLLHFINPNVYPIIDSNIIKYLKNTHSIRVGVDYKNTRVQHYVEYKDICHVIIEHEKFNGLFDGVKKMLAEKCDLNEEQKNALKDITKIRVLEFLFFELGKKS